MKMGMGRVCESRGLVGQQKQRTFEHRDEAEPAQLRYSKLSESLKSVNHWKESLFGARDVDPSLLSVVEFAKFV